MVGDVSAYLSLSSFPPPLLLSPFLPSSLPPLMRFLPPSPPSLSIGVLVTVDSRVVMVMCLCGYRPPSLPRSIDLSFITTNAADSCYLHTANLHTQRNSRVCRMWTPIGNKSIRGKEYGFYLSTAERRQEVRSWPGRERGSGDAFLREG